MAETITDIATAIKRHREMELDIQATNEAVGRCDVNFNGQPKQMWILTKEYAGAANIQLDIQGNFAGAEIGNDHQLRGDGPLVYRDSLVGAVIVQNNHGTHILNAPAGHQSIEILNKSIYNPDIAELAIELTVFQGKSVLPKYFATLSDLLVQNEALGNRIIQLELELESANEVEEETFRSNIEALKLQQQKNLQKAQSFIRKQAALRHQPILDQIQDRIRRSRFFTNPLAIDGGPGTGKTTSLIQRIKFLTDAVAIEENLPKRYISEKSSIKDNWVFFSPNELLMLYLKSNMEKEGLVLAEKVKVWSDELTVLMRQYKLFNSDTQRPFLQFKTEEEQNLLPIRAKELKRIVDDFENYFLQVIQQRIQRTLRISTTGFEWTRLADEIQSQLKRAGELKSLDQILSLYFNLQQNFALKVSEALKDYADLMSKASTRVQRELELETVSFEKAKAIIENWKAAEAELDEDEEDEDELEDEDFEDQETSNADIRLRLLKKIRTLIRKKALEKLDNSTKWSSKESELIALLSTIDELPNFERIAQLAFFKKHFEKSTKGVARNIFSVIPAFYKRFRKTLVKADYKGLNATLLEAIIKRDKNKRIHPQEQALLVFFINSMIKRSYANFARLSEEINHPYFMAYRKYSRAVIAIDEATDFHIVDLVAMSSFGWHRISSVTFSGDLLQRMTNHGLREWSDLKVFLKDFELEELQISYRQGHLLLELAKAIYRVQLKKEPSYKSYLEPSENEPKPLIYIAHDEGKKINWIAEKIIEIYRAYGVNIPSIAVFLESEDQLEHFARELGKKEELFNVGISVKACRDGQVLGSKNTVRVFSIEHIKGLEFQAVFFHNFHKLVQTRTSAQLLNVLYVALTRATFYLRLTSSEEFPSDLTFLNDHFEKLQE